jgi:hypothetical protein
MGHLGGVIAHFYFCNMCCSTFTYNSIPFPSPLCSGLNSFRLLSPKIWRPPCSKPENDLDDATEKNKLASLTTRRRRLAPDVHQKHPRSRVATPSQQHFHHDSRIKPKCRWCQLNPNQWRRPAPIASVGVLANSSHLGKCRAQTSPS